MIKLVGGKANETSMEIFTILGIGVIAAILDFLCGAPKIGTWPISGILIDIFGIFMAITMLREMIHTLESGRWQSLLLFQP